MTPDTDDLSSTFVPHSSQGYYPIRRSPRRRMSFELPHVHAGGPSYAAKRRDTDASEVIETISPSDDGVKRSFQIDMKDLVGDAVGNMSISPSYRDVVLAARKGLFIIDLRAPLEVPRFLPQGGTWDVADVQWNPHPAGIKYVVSTSSEKLLIWNLMLSGKTSIEHVLHSHYRAITDINWHTQDPDIVVSTGVDSWLWAWDLRTTNKPVMGFCAFNAGGTQVKWNRQDGHVLASSHMDEVLIWDRRKGSVPIQRIKAHNAKIYGIDWAHNSSREIVTCSLDKTVKVWDVHGLSGEHDSMRYPFDMHTLTPKRCTHEPLTVIHTSYPVWRARDLPFGNGILSLPQRGENALELWTREPGVPEPKSPVEVFEGHTDTVKEFVWRRGDHDWNEFQLITWSKDKTLRFWPMDHEAIQRAGQPSGTHVTPRAQGYADNSFSFRTPPAEREVRPSLSAPVGHRGILAEVRAGPPQHPLHPSHVQRGPPPPRSSLYSRLSQSQSQSEPELTPTVTALPISIEHDRRRGGTMSRGNVAGKSAHMDPFTWISNITVPAATRDGSSGTGSGQESGNVSRMGSRSRAQSREPGLPSITGTMSAGVKRSDSRTRWDDDGEGQSLRDEITSALKNLSSSSSRIKLEKHDLTKKRTCTLGLHGPWGESSSVFIRITFTFPKDYPHASYPGGTPTIDLERTPLISMRNRAFILRRLRAIREARRPCLEACLRFLVFGNEDEHERLPVHMGFESSSEDEDESIARQGRNTAVTMLHSNKNIAEPRTSQGVFGPNGQLVCFNRAPPRIVRNPLHELSASPSAPARSVESIPRLFQSPALLSDAVRRLAVASQDRRVSTPHMRPAEDGDNILHIMTNLLLSSRLKQRRASEQSRTLDDIPAGYLLAPAHVIVVFVKDASYVAGTGEALAKEYVFEGKEPAAICGLNAAVAKKHGRYDHERFFNTMRLLFPKGGLQGSCNVEADLAWGSNPLVYNLIMELYKNFAHEKDIQMLAMIAVFLLRMHKRSPPVTIKSPARALSPTTPGTVRAPIEYFGIRRRRESRTSTPLSPSTPWARPTPSPTTNAASTSFSSRGSWSSLFNTSSMRQLMTSKHESNKDAPNDYSNENLPGIPVPGGGRRHAGSESPRYKTPGTDSPHSQIRTPPLPQGKSWPESTGAGTATRIPVLSTSTNARRPTFSQVVSARVPIPEKILVVEDLRAYIQRESAKEMDLFEKQFLVQLVNHIGAYAEILFRWQLLHKRIELLKAVDQDLLAPLGLSQEAEASILGVSIVCTNCGSDATSPGRRLCEVCEKRLKMPLCSICRLPVKGLSFSCLQCHHVSHMACWRSGSVDICATGCGCRCRALPDQVLDSIDHYVLSPQEQRLSMSPPPP